MIVSLMFRDNSLSLIYFTSDPVKGRTILKSGADAVLIDCENAGKISRQTGFNTEINYNDPAQVGTMRGLNPFAHIMCRVNNDFGASAEQQIRTAISYGVDSIVLPMTETAEHVRKANSIIDGEAKLVVMIESQTGIENFAAIAQEQFSAVYIGLNDLSISRGGQALFAPLYDGTVSEIIAQTSVPVGVGGVTEPSMGSPIKSEEIIAKYAELGVKFSVLRRSFESAIVEMPAATVISNIKGTYLQNAKMHATIAVEAR